MIMPAFLPEDLAFLIDIRVEDRVQIYMHQILKITVIAAGDRVARFVRISHRVEEGIERPFDQLHKRILKRKIARTAEHAVLQDVCHSGAVLRRRPEGNVKHLVIVLILDQHHPGSGLFMTEDRPF